MFSLPTYDKILTSFLWFHADYTSLCSYIYCYSYPLFHPASRKLCCLFYAQDELPAPMRPNPKSTDGDGDTSVNFTALAVKPVILYHAEAQEPESHPCIHECPKE